MHLQSESKCYQLSVGGWVADGVEVGKVTMVYPSNRAINISNYSGQFIFRFVTHNSKLVVNGRIVEGSKFLMHKGNWKVVVKGLLKLLAYGAKREM